MRDELTPPRSLVFVRMPSQVLLENGYLAKEPAAARPVVYLAVVDESGGPEYHDVMAEVLYDYLTVRPLKAVVRPSPDFFLSFSPSRTPSSVDVFFFSFFFFVSS